MNSGGTSPPHATAIGGTWVHAPPQKSWKTGGSCSASSPLPFPPGSENPRHLQKIEKHTNGS